MDWEQVWIVLGVILVCAVLVAADWFHRHIEDDKPGRFRNPNKAVGSPPDFRVRSSTTHSDEWKRAREEVYAPTMEHLSREAPQSTERPAAPDPTLGAPCRYRRLSGERCPVCEARE